MSFLKLLDVKNFKSFQNTQFTFGKLTVLAGINGVGKSSLIQSLLLLRRAYQIEEGENISVNDKENTFLELGNTEEIVNIEAEGKRFSFQFENTDSITSTIEFTTDEYKKQVLTLSSAKKINSPFEVEKTFHYLNAERIGPRKSQSAKDEGQYTVGFQGENTGYILELVKAGGVLELPEGQLEKRLFPEDKVPIKTFLKQVESWMNFIIPNVEISTSLIDQLNETTIRLKQKGSETSFLHANNIGFGISYVLPVVVSGLFAKKGEMFIVENPEAHLHPSGQSAIGQFLAHMAGAGVQVVVETHSEHVINGIRLAVLKNRIGHEKVCINFFDNRSGSLEIQAISLSENGDLSDWPFGFFDQTQQDIAKILKEKRNRKK
jgi:predicted ATPase